VQADQAAGLRRRKARQPLRCIHCFFESADASTRLAQALHRLGRSVLLIDLNGRLFDAAATRSLFDWRRQLERGQLYTLPQAYGGGWHAPGMQADEAGLLDRLSGYDPVLFDAGRPDAVPGLLAGAVHDAVVETGRSDESMRYAYALVKTLMHRGGVSRIGLLGDAGACEQVQAACCHFIGQAMAHVLFNAAREDAPFAALAVRMASDETRLAARDKTERSGNMALKHGG
jgi:hypothetical protein